MRTVLLPSCALTHALPSLMPGFARAVHLTQFFIPLCDRGLPRLESQAFGSFRGRDRLLKPSGFGVGGREGPNQLGLAELGHEAGAFRQPDGFGAVAYLPLG